MRIRKHVFLHVVCKAAFPAKKLGFVLLKKKLARFQSLWKINLATRFYEANQATPGDFLHQNDESNGRFELALPLRCTGTDFKKRKTPTCPNSVTSVNFMPSALQQPLRAPQR